MTSTEQQAPSAPAEEETASGPFDGLKDAFRGLGKTVLDAGFHRAGGLTDKLTSRLSDFAEGKKEQADESDAPGPMANAVKEAVAAKVEGDNPATAAIKGALGGVKNKLTGGGKGGKGGKGGQKFSNIVEWIDVGVPLRVAYNQWTEFEQWTSFMKKVETVQRNEEQGKVAFKARVFLSHRSWESTIVEMVPDDHIVWQSSGQKGYLNGGITFHELAPTLTRMCVVVEYHPQGIIEKTLNIWRAVGRAVRRELKRYVRQVMTVTILAPDDVQGWRAEIRDQKIVRTHDEVVEQEQREAEEAEAQQGADEGDEFEEGAEEGDEFEEGAEEPAAGAEDETEDEFQGDEDQGDEGAGSAQGDAYAGEDATYAEGEGEGEGEGEEPVDESEDEGAYDEEPEDEESDEGDESDEGEEGEEPADEAEDRSEDEDRYEEEPDESDESDEGDEEDSDGEDRYDDEAEDGESEGDEGDDEEFEDEESEGSGGADDEYEDEGEGSEDEYEDEESEDQGPEEADEDEPEQAEDRGGESQEATSEDGEGTTEVGGEHAPQPTRPARRRVARA